MHFVWCEESAQGRPLRSSSQEPTSPVESQEKHQEKKYIETQYKQSVILKVVRIAENEGQGKSEKLLQPRGDEGNMATRCKVMF